MSWKYPLVVSIVTAVIAASIQVVSVLLQESPDWGPLGGATSFNVVGFLVFIASMSLPYSYFLHSATHRHGLDIVLLVIGFVLTALSMVFHNALVDIFFPKTLISGFVLLDSFGIAFAGYMLLLYLWGEARRKRKLARQLNSMEATQS